MRFIVRRLAFYLLAFWIAITLNFLIPRLIPGDPASALFAHFQGRVSVQQLQAMKAAFGFDQGNLFQQYITYISHLAQGDLSLSFSHYPTPVTTVIAQDLPWTLLLVGLAVVISFSLGTLIGIIAAWRRGGFIDTFVPPVLLFFWSFPPFWIGLLMLYVLGLNLGWFPMAHSYDLNLSLTLSWPLVVSVLDHALMPAMVLVITTIGSWTLGMRNNMVATLNEDYITLAEARGLAPRRIMFWYAARNAILPQLTSFAIALGLVVSGQVLIELVFSYPGVGFELVQSAFNQDFPLLQGLMLFIVLAVLVANFLMDIMYVWLDPRVRQEA
jgi:peptide/nickel transport system permease protein